MYLDLQKIVKQTKLFHIFSVCTFVGLIIMSGIFLTRDIKVRHLKKSPYFTDAPPLNSYCFYAFTSLLKEDIDKAFFKREIITQIEESSYSLFEFDQSEKILRVISDSEKKTCKVILEDKNGLRYFNLSWKPVSNSDHYLDYIIYSLIELKSIH